MEDGKEVKEQERTWRLYLGGCCRNLTGSGGSFDESYGCGNGYIQTFEK